MSIIAEVNECRNCGEDLPIGVIYCLDCTFYNNLKKDKEMSIFKKDDRVFDINYSWGTVSESDRDVAWPIQVNFDSGRIINYKLDGSLDNGLAQTLSFKPYDLINGGFSQERPKPEIEKGQLLFCRNNKGFWQMGYFLQYGDNKDCVFITPNPNEGFINAFAYDEYSLEHPHEG